MTREVLTQRIENGWASADGRIRALRDVIPASATLAGASRRSYWTIELLNEAGDVVEDDSVNTLAEADEAAFWLRERDD